MLYFADNCDDRPPSILLTTLAAKAYRGETDLVTPARAVLAGMHDHIETRNGKYWVPNPAHEKKTSPTNRTTIRDDGTLTWRGTATSAPRSTTSSACMVRACPQSPPGWKKASGAMRSGYRRSATEIISPANAKPATCECAPAASCQPQPLAGSFPTTYSMGTRPVRRLNPAQQMLALRAMMPGVTGTARRGVLNCVMPIQPSPISQVYTVRILQQHGGRPQVTVIDPPLQLYHGATSLPHVYPGDELCLYYPGQRTSSHALRNPCN